MKGPYTKLYERMVHSRWKAEDTSPHLSVIAFSPSTTHSHCRANLDTVGVAATVSASRAGPWGRAE